MTIEIQEQRFDHLEKNISTLNGAVDRLDSEVEILNGTVGELNDKFDLLSNKFDRLESKFDLFVTKVDQRFDQIDQRFDYVEDHLSKVEELAEDTLSIVQFMQEVGVTKQDLEPFPTKEDLAHVEKRICARIQESESKQRCREVEQLKVRVSRLETAQRMLYPDLV